MGYQCVFFMIDQNDLEKLIKYNINDLIEKLDELEKTGKSYSTFLDYFLGLRLFFSSIMMDFKIENIENLAWFTGTHKINFYEDDEINFFEKYENFENIVKLLEKIDIDIDKLLEKNIENFETTEIIDEYNDLLTFYKEALENKKTIIYYQKQF